MLNKKFWQYYKTFEDDINRLSRYVEITEDNFSVYSVELTRLFLSICSEVDVVLKEKCKLILNKKVSKMPDYLKILHNSDSIRADQNVVSGRFGLNFLPWKSATTCESPKWWKDHNKVKHDRSEYYTKANLGNVLEALAGLYVANLHLNHLQIASISPPDYKPFFEDTVTGLVSTDDLFQLDCLFYYISE
ncbi:hypothetical protein SG34_013630 [Thalassomonas viridans]|uniref:Uncharacterized protein n=1 Tax=Thalassomonas viridans TaxID=137584 RepID=A0AAE9Z6U4_9GAMM|nr:hypothetical protein [Thalassomonas viridans]WDE07826.1 hypothetical protein SG34_013630 [Thalassomonas viridans]